MIEKCCTKCGAYKPATREFFSAHKLGRCGLQAACKLCQNERVKERYALDHPDARGVYADICIQSNGTHKKCARCGEIKPATIEYFSKQYLLPNRFKVTCKTCANDYNRQWHKDNAEYHRAISRQWKKDHPEQHRMNEQKRNATKRKLPATLSQEQWEGMNVLYNNSCAYCGQQSCSLVQEHILPIAQGGGYTANNIVPACKSCNSKKGARTPNQARMSLRLIAP